MNIDIKVVIVVLLALCLVAESEGWWKKRSSSRNSRVRSTRIWRRPSRRGSSSTSSSSSTSRRPRRRWFRSRRVKPTKSSKIIPTRCSLRIGCIRKHVSSIRKPSTKPRCGLLCKLKKKIKKIKEFFKKKTTTTPTPITTSTTPSTPTPTPTTPPTTSSTSTTQRTTPTTSSPLNNERPPALNPPISAPCFGATWLLSDIVACSRKWEKPHPIKELNKVFEKNVIGIQIVERPMGHCGYRVSISSRSYNVSEMYGTGIISCLHSLNVKTSMSERSDSVMHSGVVVETQNHEKYLIHKGINLGDEESRTIIEVARGNMYEKGGFKALDEPFKPKSLRKVKEYYDKCGIKFNILYDNSHDGTLRMVRLALK